MPMETEEISRLFLLLWRYRRKIIYCDVMNQLKSDNESCCDEDNKNKTEFDRKKSNHCFGTTYVST